MAKITLLIAFVMAIIGVVGFKKQTTPFKLLCAYLCFTLIYNVANYYIGYKYHNNAPVTHIIAITNYLFFASIYYYLFKNKLIRLSILVSMGAILVFFLINACYLQPFFTMFPSYVLMATEVLLVICAITLFKQMLLYPIQVNIVKQGVFWYNTAILFFSAIMFLNYALFNYLSTHHYNPIVFYFWDIAEILLNLLLGVAVLVEKKGLAENNYKTGSF